MRSEAQKRADKAYAEKNKGKYTRWATWFTPQEAKEIDEKIKASGMNKAEFIRWAVKKLEEEQK